MNINLQPNITGTNINLVKGATQADLTNSVNNSKTYRDESEAFSIVSENKSIIATYSANSASYSATTASNAATIATTKTNEANNSANSASASETVCIAKATIATDNADIAIAQAVIATNKATEANTSANTATTQAGISTTKASEASISASNALTSENNADTSEANALTYRNQAESFANSINPSDLVHISGTETITGNKTFSGTVSGLTKTTVGLSNVDNTSDANKPISNEVQTALYLKADKATTLGGYGITDAYTKTSTDSLIDIHSKTAKTTLADADEFMTADSTSSWSLKKITWASIKNALTSLFISKVTSTDNAVVRFDGTTGQVQNSGVVIDDNNNVGIGTSSIFSTGGKTLHLYNNLNDDTANSNSTVYLESANRNSNVICKGNNVGFQGWDSSGNIAAIFGIDCLNKNAIITTNGIERMRIDANGSVHIRSNLIYMGSNDISVLHTDTNWGLLYKALRPDPLAAEHAFFKSDGITNLFSYNNTSGLTVNQPTGLGYGLGAGGTVTQLTSKGTAVTLNKPTGMITMNTAALAAGTTVSFIFYNSIISAIDMVVVTIIDDFSGAAYKAVARHTYSGYAIIDVTNTTAASRSEAVRISYSIIKGANA